MADMTAYKYGSALIPPTWTICGVILRPFSMGSFLILESIGNPIIEDKPIEMDMATSMYWFFQALLICASSYDENIRVLGNEELHMKTFEEFSQNLIKNMDADPEWNIFHKINLFKEYMNYYMDIPIYTEENSKKETTPSGTDWKQNIYLTFKKLGYSEAEILNMNFRKLFYEWCSYAEAEGAIKVWNAMDVFSFKRLKGIK